MHAFPLRTVGQAAGVAVLTAVTACAGPVETGAVKRAEGTMSTNKVVKTEAEWKAQLTPEQYRVARQAGTERAFTGAYWNHKEAGTYACIGCGAPLFASDTKFDSGCGWPSFYQPATNAPIGTSVDHHIGYARTEVHCDRCGAHLGHVFDDGPQPTGQRYCINSASIHFVPKEGAVKTDKSEIPKPKSEGSTK